MTVPTTDRLDAYFAHIRSTNPAAMQIWIADTEIDFYSAAEEALEAAIARLESGARQIANLNELALSWMLVNDLVAASIPATPEGYHNGHVDVTIRHPRSRPYLFLGECKLYGGYEHHCEGCDQLLNRYSSGRSNRTFCLEFFNKTGMYERLRSLRAEFNSRRPLQQVDDASDHRISGAFLTAHGHFTGARVEILHLGCNVFHPDVA